MEGESRSTYKQLMKEVKINPLDVGVTSYSELVGGRTAQSRALLPIEGRKVVSHLIHSILGTKASYDSTQREDADPVVKALVNLVKSFEWTKAHKSYKPENLKNQETRGIEDDESESESSSSESENDYKTGGKRYRQVSLFRMFRGMQAAAWTELDDLWTRNNITPPDENGSKADKLFIQLALRCISLGTPGQNDEGEMFTHAGACA